MDKKKITVALDLDGVIWDLVRPWVAEYNRIYKDNLLYEDITDYDLSKFMTKIPNGDYWWFLNYGWFWNLVEPFENSYEYMKRLNEDYNLVVATKTHYNLYKMKVELLLAYFPFLDYNQIICIGDKSLLNVDFLVDDCLDNLKGGKFTPIVLDAPYNRDSDYLRAKDLKEVYELIKEIEHA